MEAVNTKDSLGYSSNFNEYAHPSIQDKLSSEDVCSQPKGGEFLEETVFLSSPIQDKLSSEDVCSQPKGDAPEEFLEETVFLSSPIQDKLSSEDVCSQPKGDVPEEFLDALVFLSENTKEALKSFLLQTFRDKEGKYVDQQERVDKKRSMKEFSTVMQKVKGDIAQLRARADKADKVHRNCTISNLVTGSTNIVSGVLSIAGLALAPVTGGLSLGLSAAGIGLGTVSAVAEVTTGIVEFASMKRIKADANKFVSMKSNTEESLKEVVRDIGPKLVPLGENFVKGMGGFKDNIRGIQLIKANPRLEARALRFMNSGKISARKAMQVKKAFGGTALAMSKGARMAGMATAGLFLLKDIYDVVDLSIHLHKGARTESADKLREQVSKIEKIIENLKEMHVISLQEHRGQKHEQN